MGTKAIRATSLVKNSAEEKEINTSIIPVFRVLPLPLPRSFPEKKGKDTEQQPDSVGVDIIYIICNGNKHTGNKGGDTRNNENKFMLEKLDKGFHFFHFRSEKVQYHSA